MKVVQSLFNVTLRIDAGAVAIITDDDFAALNLLNEDNFIRS